MLSGEMLLRNTVSQQHVVSFYREIAGLTRSVGNYISEGLTRGEIGLILATRKHIQEFLQHLTNAGYNPTDLQGQGQLVVLDAQEMLVRFMIEGKPNARLFDSCVGQLVRDLLGAGQSRGLRAYGEMVGVLWLNGQFSAAMAVEELWNDLMQHTSFSLFCGYPIDIFDRSFHRCDVDAVMCSHAQLVSEGSDDGGLESAVSRALDDTDSARGQGWRHLFQDAAKPPWASALPGEALILWIREHFSETADEILMRARGYLDSTRE
jgi:hypothetical protein